MADRVDPHKRSEIMAAVRGKDTKPELSIRRRLHARGFRYSLHNTRLPGRPDLTLRKYRTAIFVHGCFWHRHEGCPRASTPATNIEFWSKKFLRTVERDRENVGALVNMGWRVILVWECALKDDPDVVANQVANWILKRRFSLVTIPAEALEEKDRACCL